VAAGSPQRVLVVGPPGSGKSWIAERAAAAWRLPHTQLDALKLQPIRQVRAPHEYDQALRSALAASRWLLDGNWDEGELARGAWGRADVVIQADLPRALVLVRVLRRSLRRVVRSEDYFGWDERVRDWLSPTHPLRWSWKMAATYRDRYRHLSATYRPARHVVLRSRREVLAFVRTLEPVATLDDEQSVDLNGGE
jgi:adenylate kinase family enzyme